MFSFVRGQVVSIAANRVVIDVGGVGLQLSATPAALTGLRVGSDATLNCALVVREDAWQLFGFGDSAEREWFELLQSVSGIGPKLALTILSAISADDLAAAVHSADEARLIKIPGVGKKSAGRLIVELGDRLPKRAAPAPVGWQADVQQALRSLGWSDKDADWAVEAVAEEIDNDADSASALRAALTRLGGERRR